MINLAGAELISLSPNVLDSQLSCLVSRQVSSLIHRSIYEIVLVFTFLIAKSNSPFGYQVDWLPSPQPPQ